MPPNNPEGNAFDWSQWIESLGSFYLSAAKSWQAVFSALAGSSVFEEYVRASLSMWRAFQWPSAGMQDFAAKASPQPSFDMFQAMMRVMDHGGLSKDMSKWLPFGGAGADSGFEKLQHEMLKVWAEFYEKAIRPSLKVPQVGLTRVFQEKINRFTDKFNKYQAAVSEFQMLLSVPMEKSFVTMREELDRLKEKDELSEDHKVYYGIWIKVLENHYMSLFRSAEYREALSRLINETAALRITGNEVLTDLLQFLPIPTNKDMDEVYRELYVLKKQAGDAAKRINAVESALAKG
jgi:class III poly(R)-hydroxyalkanoic acid synthase PhaE subunit